MHLFYTPDITSEQELYQFSEEESKHSSRVLRLTQGDEINLVDGSGGFYAAVIEDPHPKRTLARVLSVTTEYRKRNHFLHIAIAPTKNIDRFEWFLEKSTEIGIDEITPIICDHSERTEIKLARLEKVLISAMKQSLSAYLPKLNPAISFDQLLPGLSSQTSFIAHCREGKKNFLTDRMARNAGAAVLIGPEGDFSVREIEQSLSAGITPVNLGETRLRTETAGLYACMELNLLNR